MIRSGKYILVIFCVLILALACSKNQPEVKKFDLSKEVARLDDSVFTLEDLNSSIYGLGWLEKVGLKLISDTASFNMGAADKMITDALVTEAARGLDIDTSMLVRKQMIDHIRQYVLQKMYEDIVVDIPPLDSAAVDTFYENHKDTYFVPESAEAAQILVSADPSNYLDDSNPEATVISSDSADRVATSRMLQILGRIDKGDSFEDVAKDESDDKQSGQNGGYIGWLQKGKTPPAFDSALFALRPGEVSPVVKTQYGYHLIKQISYKDSSYYPLDEGLREYIENGLKTQRGTKAANDFLDSLRNVSTVTYNEKLLAKVDTLYEPFDWLAMVNKTDSIFAFEVADFFRNYKATTRKVLTKDDRMDIVKRFVTEHVLDLEARKRGYYERPDIRKEIDEFVLNLKKQQFQLMGEIGKWKPSDQEVADYYEEHRDEYSSERPLKVKHILFEDSLKAAKVFKEISDGADFDKMAMKYYPGDKDVRESLYNLGWISKDEMPQNFFAAAWVLDTGQVSRPIRTEYGYHLIRLEDRRPMMTLEEATPAIIKKLTSLRKDSVQSAWKSALYKGHTVSIDSVLVREFVYQIRGDESAIRDSTELDVR